MQLGKKRRDSMLEKLYFHCEDVLPSSSIVKRVVVLGGLLKLCKCLRSPLWRAAGRDRSASAGENDCHSAKYHTIMMRTSPHTPELRSCLSKLVTC